jgi:hypothetical protein
MTNLEKLINRLPSLEVLIEAQTGIHVKGKMRVKTEESRHDKVTYRIYSESLHDLLDPLSRQIFRDISFYFWGGTVIEDDTKIWFSPKVSYEHVLGGSNGCDIIWNNLWFDIETETWIPSK